MSEKPDQHLEVFQRHRPRLFSIAYRMMGSASQAEDVLQEAYSRFLTVALDEVVSPQAFLSTIVSRLCLYQLTSARAKRETYPGPWLPEPVLSGNNPELASPEGLTGDYASISLAFLALLERLTPAERAVFILREVFEFDYAEISAILEKSEATCRKLFSRAKSYIAANRPRFHASPEAHRRLLFEFIQAAGQGDLDGLTALLAEEVTFWADGGGKVRGAALQAVRGRINVVRFVIMVTQRFLPEGARFVVAEVNGKPALLIHQADGRPALVVSIGVREKEIEEIWVIANPDKLSGVLI